MFTTSKRYLIFANRKGGCGKTTTAVNVAHALARNKRRVLLFDMDPQAHATISLGIHPGRTDHHIGELLEGEIGLGDLITPTQMENLHLAPSSPDLTAYEIAFAPKEGSEIRLYERIDNATEGFEYLIFDPPPTVGLLAVSSLVAAREVFIPMPMHFLAMEGLAEMMRLIYRINATWNPNLRLGGIIPTFYNRNTCIARQISADIAQNFGESKLLPGIRMNISLAEAPAHGRSIFDHAPRSAGAKDYDFLTQIIETMPGKEQL